MSISYATSPFSFVDSQFGTAATATGIKVNVPIITDIRYHKRVQDKTFFAQKGLIGPDTFSEGSVVSTSPGLPVIRKSDFLAKKGDTIIMHQRTNLAATNSVGRVAGFQIVDAEVGWDLNYKKVKIEQWRQAVRTDGGMNAQRNPVDESFVETELDLLSDWTAQVQDSGILAGLHYGWSYHVLRQYGTTNCPRAMVANDVMGNDETLSTSGTVADLVGDGSDNLKGATIELGYLYCTQNNFDPIRVGGDAYFVCLVSPRGMRYLFKDEEFRNAMMYARDRGVDNPLFKSDAILYHNVLIFPYDKIRSILGGYNPAGLTVSNGGAYNSSITEAAYTGIGDGVASTNLHQTYFLGANAVALAEGPMKMAERTETDYGMIIGRAADNTWGAERMDWLDATGTANNNQSAALFINTLV